MKTACLSDLKAHQKHYANVFTPIELIYSVFHFKASGLSLTTQNHERNLWAFSSPG